MDREKIENIVTEFNNIYGHMLSDKIRALSLRQIAAFWLSKIAEAETHMAEIAIEQINAIEGDLMEEEHESLSNLCKYARDEIKATAIKKIEGL